MPRNTSKLQAGSGSQGREDESGVVMKVWAWPGAEVGVVSTGLPSGARGSAPRQFSEQKSSHRFLCPGVNQQGWILRESRGKGSERRWSRLRAFQNRNNQWGFLCCRDRVRMKSRRSRDCWKGEELTSMFWPRKLLTNFC